MEHSRTTGEAMMKKLREMQERFRFIGDVRGRGLMIGCELVKDRKTEGDRIFDAARKQGFVRVRVDGEMYDLAEAPTLDKYKRHTIEVVVDRFVVREAEAPADAPRSADGRPLDPATGERRYVPEPDTGGRSGPP